jgi:hypothetical protein
MDYALIVAATAVVLAALLWGILKGIRGGRYANMTEEEFETEARRPSLMTSEMTELQRMYAPGHRAEYIQVQQECAEADRSESGDKPSPGETKPI